MMLRLQFWKDKLYLLLWERWQRFQIRTEMRRIMREDAKETEEQ